MHVDAEGGDHQTARPANGRDHARLAAACSSHPPQIAADDPRTRKKRVNIQPRSNCVQSQSTANSACPVMASLPAKLVASPGQAIGLGAPLATATARPSGTQNTLKP